jgi:hypothetical protein
MCTKLVLFTRLYKNEGQQNVNIKCEFADVMNEQFNPYPANVEYRVSS